VKLLIYSSEIVPESETVLRQAQHERAIFLSVWFFSVNPELVEGFFNNF